jgi:DNA-binding NtrC family response regulator
MPEADEHILVVDDTPTNISLLLDTLEQEGYRVLVASDGASAIEQVGLATPMLILLDVRMPGIDGFETCRRLKADPATRDIPVIFLTALDDPKEKLRAFQEGAVDFITKPLDTREVLARVRTHARLDRLRRRLEAGKAELEAEVAERTTALRAALAELQQLRDRLAAENDYLRREIAADANLCNIVGKSPALRELMRSVELVAATDCTVLITGETGTGKELVARALHERSPRRERALVKLNCSAISAGLVESELFGHVKGAFTGATERRTGRFELADHGTLFLDEVGELPLETQAKLLRVLQEQEFEPVGSSRPIKVDVRVIAATNRDLAADVADGRFRSDLYYRLNVFPVETPPLRARGTDIPLLAEFFLQRASRRLGKAFTGIEPDTLQRLCAHDWPGNVRDLQNTIERAAILSQPPRLRVDWPLSVAHAVAARPGRAGFPGTPPGPPAHPALLSLEHLEREHIVAVLRQTHGVIEGPKGAALLLGLKPSTTRFRIRKLGIQRSEFDRA